MIEFISEKSNGSNFILFVHGFTGGFNTWSFYGKTSFPTLLLQDQKISDHFDIAQFTDNTKLTNLFAKISNTSKLLKNFWHITWEIKK